jgi:ribosomal protein S12 methylthiotransferase accessory factor YcaO
MLLGAGASLDPETAICSAVSELTKILLYREISRSKWTLLSPTIRSYLRPSRAPRITLSNHARIARPDLHKILKTCVDRLAALGLEIYTLNVTRPEVGFPVARVIVPGLRHWRPRFGPGRLYDAPVAMAWCPRKLKESELNPEPFLL